MLHVLNTTGSVHSTCDEVFDLLCSVHLAVYCVTLVSRLVLVPWSELQSLCLFSCRHQGFEVLDSWRCVGISRGLIGGITHDPPRCSREGVELRVES